MFNKKVREEDYRNRDGGNNGACGSISHRRHGRDYKLKCSTRKNEGGRGLDR